MAFDYKNASKSDLQKEYDRIAKEMGDNQFFTKKELHHLPEILLNGEQVLGFTSGMMDGNTWLITLTDRRIIFLDKGMLSGLKQTAIPLDKINAISGKTGLLLGEIIVTDGAKDRKITNVLKKTVKPFTNLTENAMANLKNINRNTDSSTKNENVYDQLEKLAALKEKGIINASEFDIEKKKILGNKKKNTKKK